MAKPATLSHSKTLHKPLVANVGLTGVAIGNVATFDITAALTTGLATAANGGGSVPVQLSADIDSEGVYIDATRPVHVIDENTSKPVDVSGEEIFAFLTEAGGVYTLTFNTSDGAGGQTAVSLPAGTYSLDIPYRFSLVNLPNTALLGGTGKYVGQDPSAGASLFREVLPVTALNTITALSKTPIAGTVDLNVDGHVVSELSTAFSLTGTAITWVTANAYDLETTDFVVASYSTLD